jgi:hypothetical protein
VSASGGNTPYTYQWEQSYQAGIGCSGSWLIAIGPNNGTSYNPPAFIATGTYCYRRKVTDACGNFAYSGVASYNVYPDLVSKTIIPIPNSSVVCAGTNVTATFSDGSGGAPGLYSDIDLFSTDGGSNWSVYGSGTPISTIGLSGSNIIQISTRREAITVAGCDFGSTNIYSWAVNPLPTLFNISGGGSYCAGGIGVAIGLSASEVGVNYQLLFGGSPIGAPIPGTGGGLNFGLLTTAGIYTVIATNPVTGCSRQMSGNQTITINQLPTTSAIYHQ